MLVNYSTSKKLYRDLRLAMREMNLNQEDLAYRILKKSTSYVDRRFNGQYAWTIEDGYTILKALNLPVEELPKYFPEGGKSA